jgi:hypothetical protein
MVEGVSVEVVDFRVCVESRSRVPGIRFIQIVPLVQSSGLVGKKVQQLDQRATIRTSG